jgi:hypothetical protein
MQEVQKSGEILTAFLLRMVPIEDAPEKFWAIRNFLVIL